MWIRSLLRWKDQPWCAESAEIAESDESAEKRPLTTAPLVAQFVAPSTAPLAIPTLVRRERRER